MAAAESAIDDPLADGEISEMLERMDPLKDPQLKAMFDALDPNKDPTFDELFKLYPGAGS